MSVPPLDLSRQHEPLAEQMTEAFAGLIASSQFILGKTVEQFEASLATTCGVQHAVGLSSGTDALLTALMAMDIGPGDEVITSPFTFFATVGSISRVGAMPVFVDIEEGSFNIDPSKIEAAITPKTRAIMPVHLFGQMANMTAINAIARKHNLKVIEDAAQAIGATHQGVQAGASGDVGCLSFYPTKNLSALGDAGACVTNDADLAKLMTRVRLHGAETRYMHDTVGGNFRIDAVQAAMLSIKLPHLADWTADRCRLGMRYNALLADLPAVTPPVSDGCGHVYNQYTLRVPGGKRDALAEHLKANGIGFGIYYPVPMHEQKCFAYVGNKRGDFPQSELAAAQVLSIPMFPGMTEAEQDEVASAIRKFYAG